MKLKNENLTFKFVRYENNNHPLITNDIAQLDYFNFYMIGEYENFLLKMRILSMEFIKMINSKYFLNLP